MKDKINRIKALLVKTSLHEGSNSPLSGDFTDRAREVVRRVSPDRKYKIKRALEKAGAPKMAFSPSQRIGDSDSEPPGDLEQMFADKQGVGYEIQEQKLDHSHVLNGWEHHNPHIVHGLKADYPVRDIDGAPGITPSVRVAHNEHTDQHYLVKPNPPDDIMKKYRAAGRPEHSHLLDENFGPAHREAAYSKLAHDFFGAGEHVPKVALFKHPDNQKPHSAMEFINDAKPYMDGPVSKAMAENSKHKHTTEKLALMNMIMGNSDRHRGNVMLTGDVSNPKLNLIDNGFTFDYGHDDPDMPAYGRPMDDEALESETHRWVHSLDTEDFKQHLAAANVPPKLASLAVRRLDEAKNALGSERRHSYGLADMFKRINMHTTDEDGDPISEDKIANLRKLIHKGVEEK